MTMIVDVVREPQPILLFCTWGVAGLTAVITLFLAINQIRKKRPVVHIIALNRIVALATGLTALYSLIGQVKMLIMMRGMFAEGPAEYGLEMLRLTHVLDQVALTILFCGINLLLALALNQKWREPQPSDAPAS